MVKPNSIKGRSLTQLGVKERNETSKRVIVIMEVKEIKNKATREQRLKKKKTQFHS